MKKKLILLAVTSLYGCQTAGPLKCSSAALKNPGHAVAFYESSELGDSKIAGYISPQASIVLTSEATADAQQAKITKDSKVAGKTVWLEKVSINCK